jgi:hypothetical protein
MKKILLSLLIIFSSVSVVSVTEARGGRGHGGHHSRHHGGYHDATAWIFIAAILGSALILSQPHQRMPRTRSCWTERRSIYDRWGNYVGYQTRQICD